MFDRLRRLVRRSELRLSEPSQPHPLELPWTQDWSRVPKRSAGPDFRTEDYHLAKERARLVAAITLGAARWKLVGKQGYLDVPSKRYPGITYRLRIGRRIEVRHERGVRPPWPQPYLCINPSYPLPEEEFFAHLYLYVRDHEDEVIRVAAPQPWDQRLGRTF